MLLRRPAFWLIALIIWFGALWLLSSQSRLQPPGPEFANRDKVMHATYFAIGGTFLYLRLRLASPTRTHLFVSLLVLLFCSVAGAIDEFHQSFVPNRSGNDLGDWLADSLGGVIASFIGLMLFSFLRPKALTVTTNA